MKITILSLDKWGYNKYIADALEEKGHEVTNIDFYKFKYTYPSKLHKIANFFTKSLFNYNFKRAHLNTAISKLIANQPKQDYTLIIKSDNLSISTIKKIKKNTLQLVTFLNDSTSRYPRMKKVFPYFDTVYAFDPDDVKKYDFNLITNYIYFDYKNLRLPEPEFNVFNISSLDKRKQTMPNFANYFNLHNIDFKLIAFSSDYDTNLDDTNIEHTTKMYSLNEVFEIVKKSRILLDLQRPKQKGLSFRVFEAIALQKKLITTNTDIVNYDFYDANNIFIVDPENIEIPSNFFSTSYKPLPPKIVKHYHISSWVKHVFKA